jgi:hypothetical protein
MATQLEFEGIFHWSPQEVLPDTLPPGPEDGWFIATARAERTSGQAGEGEGISDE